MSERLFQISYSIDNIKKAAAQFWQESGQYHIIAFSGQLGAGKTTFIHALCEHLGVTDVVSSPTFALINEYHFAANGKDNTIYHMDWYRIKDMDDAINAGMEDCLQDSSIYCFIEWPEKASELLSDRKHLWVNIEPISATERQITAFLK